MPEEKYQLTPDDYNRKAEEMMTPEEKEMSKIREEAYEEDNKKGEEEMPKTPEETASDQEAEPQKDSGEKNKEETTENTTGFFSSENQEFFREMSEKGRVIASQIYEGLNKIPGVNRVIGKMEVAYNQFWMDRHQKKAAGLENESKGINKKIENFDKSKKEIEAVIDNLKKINMPGIESLQLKLYDIDKEKMNLLNKQDKIKSEIEKRDNSKKLYAEKRDQIADTLIGRYDEKIVPMEEKLEGLQTDRDQVNLELAVLEADHVKELAELSEIEKNKKQIEESLRGIGMKENEIRRNEAVKAIESILAPGREKRRKEKEILMRKKTKIDQKIAKVDAKANSYRDKREKFVRIKNLRPIKIELETRKKEEEFKGEEEEIKTHSREERPQYEPTEEESSEETETEAEAKVEVKTETEAEQLKISSYISGWNAYLEKKYGKSASNEKINQEDFLGTIRKGKDYRLNPENFKSILTNYCKFKKIPMEKMKESIDKFFEEIKTTKE